MKIAPLPLALTLLVSSIGLSPPPVARAQTGRLAYVKSKTLYVGPAGSDGAKPIPQTGNIEKMSLAPDGKTLLYWSSPKPPTPTDTSLTGFAAPLPFTYARPLPAPLAKIPYPFTALLWNADGSSAYIADTEKGFRYDARGNRAVSLRHAVDSVSRKGDVVAYQTGTQVRVRFTETGKEKTLFSIDRPLPLFEALKHARNPASIKEFAGAVNPESAKDVNAWQIGAAAITPDARTVFFATSAGAGGPNTSNVAFGLFAVDVATGRLTVLSKVGSHYGHVPLTGEITVSPDGRRLAFLVSLHDSGFSNPCSLWIVDLETQQTRDILHEGEAAQGHKNDVNLTDGFCWSPDSRYIAVSVAWYDPDVARKQDGWELNPDTYSLLIQDPKTGHVVRRILGAHQPAWSR